MRTCSWWPTVIVLLALTQGLVACELDEGDTSEAGAAGGSSMPYGGSGGPLGQGTDAASAPSEREAGLPSGGSDGAGKGGKGGAGGDMDASDPDARPPNGGSGDASVGAADATRDASDPDTSSSEAEAGVGDAQADAGDGASGGPWSMTLTTYPVRPGALPEPGSADWVAFQDGTAGTWTDLASASGVYSFSVTDPSGRFGVAVGCASNHTVTLIHGSALESTELHTQGCTGTEPAGEHALSGDLNPAVCSHVAVNIQNLFQTCLNLQPNYTLTGIPSGTYDLLAITQEAPFRAYVERNIAFSGDVTRNIDFEDASRAAAASPMSATLPADWYMTLQLFTASTRLDLAGVGLSGQPSEYVSVPPSLLAGDDMHRWCATGPEAGASPTGYWTECRFFAAPITLAVDNSVAPPAPSATSATTSSVAWDSFSEAVGFIVTMAAADPNVTIKATLSSAWLDGATTYAIPDLSGVAAWSSEYALSTPLSWSLEANRSLGTTANMLEIQNAFSVARLAPDGLYVVRTSDTGELP